jgi:hypothetical protein
MLCPYYAGSLRFLKLLGNITKEAGESVKLKCEVTGDLPPTKIRWFKNEAPVIEEKGRLVTRRYTPQVQSGMIIILSHVTRAFPIVLSFVSPDTLTKSYRHDVSCIWCV